MRLLILAAIVCFLLELSERKSGAWMDGIRHVAFLPVNKVCASCPSRGFLSALVLAALFWCRWFVLSYPHLSPLKCLMEDALLGVSNVWCEHVALQLSIGGHQRPRGWLLVLAETVRTTQCFNSKCGRSQTALLRHLKKQTISFPRVLYRLTHSDDSFFILGFVHVLLLLNYVKKAANTWIWSVYSEGLRVFLAEVWTSFSDVLFVVTLLFYSHVPFRDKVVTALRITQCFYLWMCQDSTLVWAKEVSPWQEDAVISQTALGLD